MAKYVCDFEQVIKTGEELCQMSETLTNNVSNYAAKVAADLSSWDGQSKDVLSMQCEGQVAIALANAKQAKELGEFIKNAAKSIQKLEEELANLSI